MSVQNILRRLEFFTVDEGQSVASYTQDVTISGKITKAGSYFCDASSNPITLMISEDIAKESFVLNIKRTDISSNKVTIAGNIDGETSVALYPGENLQIQFHKDRWRII